MFESRHHSELFELCIEAGFGFRGRDVADRLEQAAVVEPVDPFESCELDRLEAAPGASPVDHLGLEEADHRLGERVIVAVADAADGGFDAGVGEALGILDRDVLGATVAVMDQSVALCGAPGVQCLLQRVEDEPGLH